MVLDTLRQIMIEPIISYPHQALAGKTYLMTVDLRMRTPPSDWPYENEEYAISFILDTMPFFAHEPVGEEDPTVILHRFGSTYGPATFLLTASQKEMNGTIRITFVNDSGIPIERAELKCEVSDVMTERPVVAKRRFEVRVPTQSSSESGSEATLQSGVGMNNVLDVSNENEMKIGEDNTASTFEGARYGTDQISTPPPVPVTERLSRLRLLERVRTFWIAGLLEHSLQQAAFIILDLQERPDVLANPLRLQVQELDRPPLPLPSGTSIVRVYDEADGELLILGEPGSGKTTLLLELTRTLLERAQVDQRQLMPVVFHLSSWGAKRPPLPDWLVEELYTKYQVPRQIASSWIKADQVIPLLDGLDEVAVEARHGCVRALNAFQQTRSGNGSRPLVVCCRSQEYLSLPIRSSLHRAVSISPLTVAQIDNYLQSGGERLEALRHALQNDPNFFDLARSPLMLNIMILAYSGAADESPPFEGTNETQRFRIFASYVERMLTRRGPDSRYTREQTMRSLAWLAKEMQSHNQSEFSLDQVQLFRRLRLWQSGAIPFNLKQFLDFAVDCVLLNKLGSNEYGFIHRLLQDYFASLGTSQFDRSSPDASPA